MRKRSVHDVGHSVPLPDRDLLLPGEVAAWLRVDSKTVSRWVAEGKLTGVYTPGGHVRLRRTDVLEMFQYEE